MKTGINHIYVKLVVVAAKIVNFLSVSTLLSAEVQNIMLYRAVARGGQGAMLPPRIPLLPLPQRRPLKFVKDWN